MDQYPSPRGCEAVAGDQQTGSEEEVGGWGGRKQRSGRH